MFSTLPCDLALSAELAERELLLERTRSDRVAQAQRLLAAEPRTMLVLKPFVDLNGNLRYWKVPRTRW